MQKAYTAGKIFTGEEWLQNVAIITNDHVIVDIVPLEQLPGGIPLENSGENILAPAFIDLQIYGAAGKLLAVYPEANSLKELEQHNRQGGTAFCLAAVATNEKQVFFNCIDAIKSYWDGGGEGILGLHIEGPWLNTEKRGAHVEHLIHAPDYGEVEELMIYGKDVIKMITIAPEVCSREVIDCILSHNVVLAAGHSNASYQEAMHGFSAGITTITHLYNAMSGMHHREPGLVGAAFDDREVMASIIPDGHHVDYAAIRIAKKIMKDRLFAITDAVTTTDRGYYQHQPAGDKFEASGTLSGSALTMNKALKNLVEQVDIDLEEAIRMCTLYPARALKQEQLGKIAKGCKAAMIVLDEDLNLVRFIRD